VKAGGLNQFNPLKMEYSEVKSVSLQIPLVYLKLSHRKGDMGSNPITSKNENETKSTKYKTS